MGSRELALPQLLLQSRQGALFGVSNYAVLLAIWSSDQKFTH